MEEEQRLIAEQEALEKAAAEPPPVEEEAKDAPNIETENLPTVAEGDEEEKKPEDGKFIHVTTPNMRPSVDKPTTSLLSSPILRCSSFPLFFTLRFFEALAPRVQVH